MSANYLELAADLITRFEQFHPRPYADPLHGWSVPTIGYGVTFWPITGKRVSRYDDPVTEKEARETLIYIIERDANILAERVPIWGDLNDHQKAAILSFCYNCGPYFYGDYEGYTSITKFLSGDEPRAFTSPWFAMFTFIKYRRGAPLGLGRRRYAEAKVWGGMDPAMAYNEAYDVIKSEEDLKPWIR